IYLRLNEEYDLSCQDNSHFIKICYKYGNVFALKTALYREMQLTGDDVTTIWEQNLKTIVPLINKKSLDYTIDSIRNNHHLLKAARSNLDWKAILLLYSMITSEQEFRRYLPH